MAFNCQTVFSSQMDLEEVTLQVTITYELVTNEMLTVSENTSLPYKFVFPYRMLVTLIIHVKKTKSLMHVKQKQLKNMN